MGRPGYIFGQFRETARCCDAQHGCGVCCAFAPQLVLNVKVYIAFAALIHCLNVFVTDMTQIVGNAKGQ